MQIKAMDVLVDTLAIFHLSRHELTTIYALVFILFLRSSSFFWGKIVFSLKLAST